MTQDLTSPNTRPVLGTLGFAFGGLALLAVLIHFAAGPFAPVQDSAVTLGELAAGMGKSALRDVFGLAQPAPETLDWDIDRILKLAVMAVGGLAVLLGLAAFLRHESRRLAFCAIGLGSAAVVVQAFTVAFAMLIGALVICAFLYAFGDIFSFG